MSVLYKALQKAQKENADRQPEAAGSVPATPTSAARLALPSVNWRLAGLGLAGVLALMIGAFVFLFDTGEPPQPLRTVQMPPPSAAPAPAPAMQPPSAQVPSAPAPVAQAPEAAAPTTAASPNQQTAPPEASTAAPATQPAAPTAVASNDAQVPATEPAKPAEETADTSEPAADTAKATPKQPAARAPAAPAAPQPMPTLAADSPARVLKPPIAIRRDEYDFSGVGDTVQVRRVSQQAQDNVTSGYNALVRGDHAMALSFYDRALQQEPRSVLAQLGRAAALQKLGNFNDARTAYERVLRIDPNNREALTNLTAIVAEREPGEALKRLLELEREYPSFSPVKAQIGLVHAKLGQMEQALDYLRRAVNLTPDAPMYHLNLALVLDRLNRKEQAVVSYERVLAAASMGRVPPDVSVADIERRVRYLRTK